MFERLVGVTLFDQGRQTAQVVAHVMTENRELASGLAPGFELFDGRAVAGREHPALALGDFLCLVCAKVDGKKHKVEGASREAQKLNGYHRARVEERGIDVGGVAEDVVDERQDEQNLQLGGAFDRQAGANVACPMQQDGKDAERGDDARHVVRDLRIDGGECGDAHPVAKLAAQEGAGNAQDGEQRTQAIACAQVDDKRQMHDERRGLSGKQLAADEVGNRKSGAGYGADPHQLERMAAVDLDTAQSRRGKDAKEQRRRMVDYPKYQFCRGKHQCLPPSNRTAK